MPTQAIGLATETDAALSLNGYHSITIGNSDENTLIGELGEVFPLTVVTTSNGGFAARDDITPEHGYLPITGMLQANTEAGEYVAGGISATLWWLWTCPTNAPYSVAWGFSYAGQSGAGGAAVRVYDPADPDVLPGSGDLAVEDTATGASGEVEALLLSPTPDQTYLIQIGIVEKAGTQSFFHQLVEWAAPPAPFTPVIP